MQNIHNDTLKDNMTKLESAGEKIEHHISTDNNFPHLLEKFQVHSADDNITKSGLVDGDYPQLGSSLSSFNELKCISKVPIPHQIMQHQNRSHSLMGVFQEIGRAWLVLDSDIFLWDFEYNSDITYYDGMQDRIIGVGLVKPKIDVFNNAIQYLMILTTASDIVVLGVMCKKSDTNPNVYDELHIVSDSVLYSLSSDGVSFHLIVGTENGRIFMGGLDGNLYELEYQSKYSWWGKKCRKVNHSASILSKFIPSLFSIYSEKEIIIQITVDNSRSLLYTLSSFGNIVMYSMGKDGTSMYCQTSFLNTNILNLIKRLFDDTCGSDAVIHISAVDMFESVHIGLVAVTSSGIRVYFKLNNSSEPPSGISISHIRVPPGYNGSIPYRATDVYAAHYSNGLLLMMSGPGNTSTSRLWCVSNDLFAYSFTFSETFSTMPMEGTVCVISKLTKRYTTPSCIPEPPVVVRQLYEPSQKFVLMSTQGIQIMEKLRPVDILSDLFIAGHEPGSDIVRQFLNCFVDVEICAMLLLLACQQTNKNSPMVSTVAARAFLLYSGEPKQINPTLETQARFGNQMNVNPHTISSPPTAVNSGTPVSTPPAAKLSQIPGGFNPTNVSTPVRVGQLVQSPTVQLIKSPFEMAPYSEESELMFQFSPKHNGLYRYVSRILRPLWNQKVINSAYVNDKLQYVIPEHLIELCKFVNSYMLALDKYLKDNPSIIATSNRPRESKSISAAQIRALQKIYGMENASLNALRTLVNHVSQVMSLWVILHKHQFHVVITMLTQEEQSYLADVTFRHLLLRNVEIYPVLINETLRLYMGDDASVDSISNLLQKMCPTIYSFEDAISTKATEIITHAARTNDFDERVTLLETALQSLKEVAPKIQLDVMCRYFNEQLYFYGIYELCCVCAQKLDKHNVAVNYYRNKESAGDSAAYGIYIKRMECYKYLISTLDELFKKSLRGKESLVITPNTSIITDSVSGLQFMPAGRDNHEQFEELLKLCLSSNDELLHSAVYDWILENKLETKLSQNSTNYLERYLQRPSTVQKFGSQLVTTILWNYYVRMGNHVAAAEVLYNLAKQEETEATLEQRIDHLTTALMCLRSDTSGAASKGALFHEVEDIYHVALVQRKVQKTLESNLTMRSNLSITINQLNKKLYNLTELYDEFVHPFNLYECKLAIIDCSTAVSCPKEIIYETWDNIIKEEYNKCTSSLPNDKMTVIMDKVASILRSLKDGSVAVDLEYLIRRLELESCRLDTDKHHVHSMMTNLGVSYSKLISTYNAMYTVNSECWMKEGDEFHIVAVIGSLGNSLVNDSRVNDSDKRYLAVHLHDMVTHCLNLLYSRKEDGHIKNLILNLKEVQKKLNKVL